MSGTVNHPAAHELHLFIDNDGDLYRQQYQPILKNLVTKQAKGVYDKDKAIKLWLYLVESGAKKYVKEYGGVWNVMFSVPTRREVAAKLNEHFLAESALGAYASLLPKKYQPQAVRYAKAKIAGGKARSAGPHPASGYAYRYEQDNDWRGSSDELWDTIVYTPTGNEKLLGERTIDGSRMRVFRTDDGWYIAQTVVGTGGKRRAGGKARAPESAVIQRYLRLADGAKRGMRINPARRADYEGWMRLVQKERRRGKRHAGGKRRAPSGVRLIAAATAFRDALKG
jgi:hypothetical protein